MQQLKPATLEKRSGWNELTSQSHRRIPNPDIFSLDIAAAQFRSSGLRWPASWARILWRTSA